MKRLRSPSTHAYFPYRGIIVFSLFIFKKKTKEAPNPNVRIWCLEGQNIIYTIAQKTQTDHFVPYHSFNAKCIP
jgi:hypothetical protein